jgi:uncharacterized protein YidB (DUF937 family)
VGLLDQILGSALGGQGNAGQGGNLMQMALQLVNSYPGGLQGLLAKFSEAGLAQHAQSWVSTGQNLPISPEQLTQALGGGHLQQLAQQFGLDPQHAASGLSGLLPEVVDKLTPGGQVHDQDIAAGLAMLKGKLLG